MNKNKKWYIINWETGILRIIKLFELFPIVEQSNKDLFLIFGYKNLSPGDKETYYLLKELAILNEKKYKQYLCQVSLDYLANVLDTTIDCQSRRIKKLEESYLVNIIKTKNNSNIYVPIAKAYPDSTLVSTLIKLIRRKRLFSAIEKYNIEKSIISNSISLQTIKNIIKKEPTFLRIVDKNIKSEIISSS